MFCIDTINAPVRDSGLLAHNLHTGWQKIFNPGSRVRGEEVHGDGFYAGVTLFVEAYCVVVVVQVGVVVEGHDGPEVFVVEKSG